MFSRCNIRKDGSGNGNGIFCLFVICPSSQGGIIQLQTSHCSALHLIRKQNIYRVILVHNRILCVKAVHRGFVFHASSMLLEVGQNRVTIHDREFTQLAVIEFPEQTACCIVFFNRIENRFPIVFIFCLRQRTMHIKFCDYKRLSYFLMGIFNPLHHGVFGVFRCHVCPMFIRIWMSRTKVNIRRLLDIDEWISFISAKSILDAVSFQPCINHVVRVNFLDIRTHFIDPSPQCQTCAILACILIPWLIHQIPRKDGRVIFILHACKIVGAFCKMLCIILVPLLASFIGKVCRTALMVAAAASTCPTQFLVNSAISFPVVFQRDNHTDAVLLSRIHDIIEQHKFCFVVFARCEFKAMPCFIGKAPCSQNPNAVICHLLHSGINGFLVHKLCFDCLGRIVARTITQCKHIIRITAGKVKRFSITHEMCSINIDKALWNGGCCCCIGRQRLCQNRTHSAYTQYDTGAKCCKFLQTLHIKNTSPFSRLCWQIWNHHQNELHQSGAVAITQRTICVDIRILHCLFR